MRLTAGFAPPSIHSTAIDPPPSADETRPPPDEEILNFATVLNGDFSTSFIPDPDRTDTQIFIQPQKDKTNERSKFSSIYPK